MVILGRTLRGACLAVLLAAPGVQADEARNWLARMAEAANQQNYQGAFVYERTGSFSTHQIWRQVDGDTTTERLLQTDGPPNEWVRRNGQLLCASSLSPGITWKDAGQVAEQPALLHNWYVLQVLGTTRVASRPVTVIAVQPRDAFRYAYELYLDNDTGLLLKSLLISDRGALLERFQFTSISFGRTDAAAVRAGPSCLPLKPQESVAASAGPSLQPGWLPPGFALGHRDVRLVDDGERFLSANVYTDGLARFTLFVEPLGEDGLADDLRAQLGPTVAVSRRLLLADGSYLATVVGEIPPAAAERIAASLGDSVERHRP